MTNDTVATSAIPPRCYLQNVRHIIDLCALFARPDEILLSKETRLGRRCLYVLIETLSVQRLPSCQSDDPGMLPLLQKDPQASDLVVYTTVWYY